MKVAVLGAAGGIGQALALLLKLQLPAESELSLYDIAPVTPGVAKDVSHIPTAVKVEGFAGEDPTPALKGADVVLISAGVARKPGMDRSDLFNIWTDCEVVTADDTFVIVDKTAPAQFDDNFQTQSIVQQQSIQQRPTQQQSIQQPPQTKAPDAPIIHTLRDEPYEFSYATKSPIKEEEMFDMYVRDIEFEEKYTQPVVEKRSQSEFVSNKGGEAPQPYNPNTSVGVQTRMFAEDEEQKLSPMDAPISDVLNKRSSNLKTYNHTFGNAGQSRTTVGKDSAGEMQIRRNNSFLHDNVD